MIIVAATNTAVTVTMDTIQAKALMHYIKFATVMGEFEAEIYTANKLLQGGIKVAPEDVFILVGQIRSTLKRLMNEQETALDEEEMTQERSMLSSHEHSPDCPNNPEKKKAETKSKTKDGDYKN